MVACSHATTASHRVVSSTSTQSTTSTSPVACGSAHGAGQTAESFTFQGQARTYQQYVPRGYDGRTKVPVVFDFHGYGSSAAQQMVYGDFKPLADRDTFLVVAPDGQGGSRHFNLTGEAGLQDDVAMVGALLDHVEATFCVDTNRVYATGMSDGGAMSSVLACKSADRFAAFAPVAVMIFVPGCGGERDESIVSFMGTADPVVPFNGGKISCCGGSNIGAAPDTIASWAAQDGCHATCPVARFGSRVQMLTWRGFSTGSRVVFSVVAGGGHAWSCSIPLRAPGFTAQ